MNKTLLFLVISGMTFMTMLLVIPIMISDSPAQAISEIWANESMLTSRNLVLLIGCISFILANVLLSNVFLTAKNTIGAFAKGLILFLLVVLMWILAYLMLNVYFTDRLYAHGLWAIGIGTAGGVFVELLIRLRDRKITKATNTNPQNEGEQQ